MLEKLSIKRLKSIFKFKSNKKEVVADNDIDILDIYLEYANDPWQIMHMGMKNRKDFKKDDSPEKSYIYKDNILHQIANVNIETYTDTVENKNTELIKEVLKEIYKYYNSNMEKQIGFVDICVQYSDKYKDDIENICGVISIYSGYNAELEVHEKIFRIFYRDIVFIMRTNSLNSKVIINIINNVVQYMPTNFLKFLIDNFRLKEIYDISDDINPEDCFCLGNVYMQNINKKINDNIILLSYDVCTHHPNIYLQVFLDTISDEDLDVLRFFTNHDDIRELEVINVNHFIKNLYDKNLDIELCNNMYESIISLNIINNIKEDYNENLFYENIDEIID